MPLENRYGNRLSRIDDDYVIVARRIEGSTPAELDPAKRREMGAGLGCYHALVEDFPEDFYYDDRVFPWLRETLKEFRADAEANHRGMIEFFLDSLRELEALGFAERMDARRADAIPAHSDFQTDNLLFDGDELVGIVDFDNIRPQPAVVDVAWTVSLTCYSRTTTSSRIRWRRFWRATRRPARCRRRSGVCSSRSSFCTTGFGSHSGTKRRSKAETSGTRSYESGSSAPRVCVLASSRAEPPESGRTGCPPFALVVSTVSDGDRRGSLSRNMIYEGFPSPRASS